MVDITRRSFLKKTAAAAFGLSLGPTIALKALGHEKATPEKLTKPDTAITLFQKEVFHVKPSLAKRLTNLETLANPNDFNDILRGIVRVSRTKGKYFSVRFPIEKIIEGRKFRRKFAKDFVEMVRNV